MDIKFEQYWLETWKPSNLPQSFDLAMKEIAQAAWNARSVVCDKEISKITSQFNQYTGDLK